jgi:predicted phage terminase large subunit-like protein
MNDQQHAQLISDLQSSFFLFVRTFYPLLTGRDFIVSSPAGRESHIITVSRELVKCANLETLKLVINIPPGHGKSTLLAFWTAWCLAKNPDSRFLYISYSQTLAASHTDTIRRILMMREFKELFGVELRPDSKAKDYFQTTSGGAVGAFGSAGAITGRDAGLPGLERFSGALILDDPHKPDEVYSDTIREKVIQNYRDTIQQRARGINVPFIMIGQRLHEADLAAYLLAGEDGHEWRRVILKSIDEAGNALYPEAFPLSMLRIRQEKDIYVFASQHQQDPQPAGGSLFKPEWFVRLDFEPVITTTFITADTAETDKSYNDATVFSFWGVYEIETMGRKTGEYGLHWIDCQELRIEPKDLKEAFMDFYGDCMRHKVPPMMAAIEKKSTGVTLTSVLSDLRGLQVRSIERNRASGSKTARFLTTQPYVAAKLISFTDGARHTDMCINHMSKITANDSHRHDDIADTLADAVRIALIDKTLLHANSAKTDYNALAQTSTQLYNKVDKLRQAAYRQ